MIRSALFYLAVLGACAGPVDADWPGFRGNPQLTGVAEGTLSDTPDLLWIFEVEQPIESTAAIVDDRVYVGAIDSSLHSLDLAAGEVLWSYRATDAIKSSPLVSGGVVYFGDESGVFHAVDASSGDSLWTLRTEGAIISPAVQVGDRLLFGSYDNSLYCVSIASGQRQWALETEGYVHAAPAALGDSAVVVSGCDARLRVVSVATGKEIRGVQTGAYVAASMAVAGTTGYVGTFGNSILAVDLAVGQTIWTYQNPERQQPFYASPAVLDSVVVIGGRDQLVHALNASSGKLLWSYHAGARIDASPVIVMNGPGERRVIIATQKGRLEILDLATGRSLWHFETGSSFTASPAVANSRLIIGSDDGTLYCFGAR